MRILAIETSCDETAIAVAEFFGTKTEPKIKILSNVVSSQVKLHAQYGGVVPNLARREHERNLVPILMRALQAIGLKTIKRKTQNAKQQLKIKNLEKLLSRESELLTQVKRHLLSLPQPNIDAIAVTHGPGLAPALWVGINFAKALAHLWKKPLIPVNHMAGHLYSAFLQKSGVNSKFKVLNSKFPAIALLVSGGHTELVLMKKHGRFRVVGETLDDAAGEAFDKVARILGLKYPGGPEIAREANRPQATSHQPQVNLPRPMIHSADYNFSFSGLKTAVLYRARDLGPTKTKMLRPAIAKEFQDAVVEVLVKKTIRAAGAYRAKTVLLGGGVAANKLLRKRLKETMGAEFPHAVCRLSPIALTGDNALMIALAAHFQWANLASRKRTAYFVGKRGENNRVSAEPNLRW